MIVEAKELGEALQQLAASVLSLKYGDRVDIDAFVEDLDELMDSNHR